MTLFGYKLFCPLHNTLQPAQYCLGEGCVKVITEGGSDIARSWFINFQTDSWLANQQLRTQNLLGRNKSGCSRFSDRLSVLCLRAEWVSVQCFHSSCISRLKGRFYLNWVELEVFFLTVIVTLSFPINTADTKTVSPPGWY